MTATHDGVSYPGRDSAGPLGAVIRTRDLLIRGHGQPLTAGANALVVLRRTAFVKGKGSTEATLDGDTERAVLRWAADTGLGQDPALIKAVARRREDAMRHRVASSRGRVHWRRLTVRPLWRMAIGLGSRLNAYEIGISLHGTYGVPVIPGSTLKGLTRSWAEHSGAAADRPDQFAATFGLDRAKAGRDEVTFLDALPAGAPVGVACDVVTVHQQPYYGSHAAPGEHHQPVPSTFLVIDSGRFAVDLLGGRDTVDAAAEWCATAVDELGIGAKTAAGYGYGTIERQQEQR
jgi:CRISPR-associated protein Cmr6